jgi:hypothetical protein
MTNPNRWRIKTTKNPRGVALLNLIAITSATDNGALVMQKALIHRYDNKADILEVEKHCCSEVYRRSTDDTFDVVNWQSWNPNRCYR